MTVTNKMAGKSRDAMPAFLRLPSSFNQLFRVSCPVLSYTHLDFRNVLKHLHEHISQHSTFRLPLAAVVAALIFEQRKSLETDVFN